MGLPVIPYHGVIVFVLVKSSNHTPFHNPGKGTMSIKQKQDSTSTFYYVTVISKENLLDCDSSHISLNIWLSGQ